MCCSACGPNAVQRGDEVDVQNLLHIVVGQCPGFVRVGEGRDRAADRVAEVVHEDVETTELVHGAVDQAYDFVPIGHVCGQDDDLAAGLSAQTLGQRTHVPVRQCIQGYVTAGLSEHLRDAGADAPPGRGDERDASVQIQFLHHRYAPSS